MKKVLFVLAVAALSLWGSQAYGLKMFSIGIESLGNYSLNSQVIHSAVTLNAYSVNVGASTMGNGKLFLIGDLRLKVGSLQTNNFTQSQSDGSFFAGDVFLGLGYRILAPKGFGIDLAPTLSAFLDMQFDNVLGFSYHYGPALGVNAFLKLGPNFGLGIRGFAKYSITAQRIQPSVQAGIVIK